MIKVQSVEELDTLIHRSAEQPVLLFKHSTRCPISAAAHDEMKMIVEDYEARDVTFGVILVVEHRPVSLACADQLGVKHESPQVILLKDGKPIWHDSHYAIRYDKLDAVLSELC